MDGLFSPPPLISGLLGADEAERLRKQSIGTGIVSALIGGLAAAPQYRYSGIAPILGQALQSGFQGMQGTYTSALENYQTQQKMLEAQRQQEQQRLREEAIAGLTPEEQAVARIDPNALGTIMAAKMKPTKPQARMLDSTEKASLNLPIGAPYQIDAEGKISLVPEPAAPKKPDFGDRREAYAMELFGQPYASLNKTQMYSVNNRIQNEDLSRTAAGAPKPPSQEPSFKDAAALRQEWRSSPVFRDYSEISRAFNIIDAAARNPSPQNDLAVATKFMKLLDPTSVVRESELAMSLRTTGIIDRLYNTAQRIKSGDMLNPTQRQEFIKASRLFKDTVERDFKGQEAFYVNIARQGGLDPNLIISGPVRKYNPKTGRVE